MKLHNLEFENYKAFFKQQNFELKPMTLIVGKNSSGKSALSRLPLLLSQSLKTVSEEPFKIQFDEIEFGGTFTDLIFKKFTHGSIKMSLNFSDDIAIDFEVQNISDTPIQLITHCNIKSKVIQLNMDLILDRDNISKSANRYYNVNGEKLLVVFSGLLPSAIMNDSGKYFYGEELSLIGEMFEIFSNQIDYIGPLREPAHRIYSYSGSIPKQLGYKGEFAPQILGMSTFVNEDLILKVGKWFKEHLGWEMAISKELKSFEVVLVNPYDSSVQINIMDVGQGIAQVLPLVVRCFRKNNENSITIIEQPELHLHPAAHGDLAELFAITAKNENSTFIIETHSENMLLRIRRLITEKKINSNNVVIYWIDDDGVNGSVLEKISIDDNGDLSNWPTGVFSEDYEEVLAITAAQKISKNDHKTTT